MTRAEFLLYRLCAMTFATLASVALLGSSGEARDLSIVDRRPVAMAVARIESLYHIPVTYEDTLYDYAGGMEDVTASVRRDHDVPQAPKRVFVPRYGSLSFQIVDPGRTGAPSSGTGAVAAMQAAERLVDEDTRRNGQRTFVVVSGKGSLVDVCPHVVAQSYIDDSGHLRAFEPLLSRLVSITMRQQTAGVVIDELRRQVSSGAAARVVEGTSPDNLLASARVDVSVRNRPARDVLDLIARQMKMPISWQLLCGPRDQECALNIHLVPQFRP